MTLNTHNRRIVLASRPVGAPVAENFRLEQVTVPTPSEGEVLVRNLHVSLDPYVRGRLSTAASYVAPVALGEVITGGTVSRVELSRHPN